MQARLQMVTIHSYSYVATVTYTLDSYIARTSITLAIAISEYNEEEYKDIVIIRD